MTFTSHYEFNQVERDLANDLRSVLVNGYGLQEHITRGVDEMQREARGVEQLFPVVKLSLKCSHVIAAAMLRTVILRGLAALQMVHEHVGEE